MALVDMKASIPRAKGCGFLALGAVAGGIVVIGFLFLIFSGMVDPSPTMPAVDQIDRVGVDEKGNGFYVEVGFADESSIWLVSRDGGATWTRGSEPEKLSGRGYGTPQLRCAEDDVCFLAHERSDGGVDTNLIDRLDPDHTWTNEAAYGGECWAEGLVVNPRHSDQALVECGRTTLAYRTEQGSWQILDLVDLARSLR